MRARIEANDQDPAESVKATLYYQKIQENLKLQQLEKIKEVALKERAEALEQIKSREAAEQDKQFKGLATNKPLFDIQDEVQIGGSLTWKKTGDTSNEGAQDQAVDSEVVEKTDGAKILRLLGFKIDFSDAKLSELRQAFIQNTMQARSHNMFLARYAQFKVGIIGHILSFFGNVSQNELQGMQKQALENAVEENIRLMGENIYNQEITEMVHGRTKKSKRSSAIFREMEKQLTNQMGLYGKVGYWSKARRLEEQLRQSEKIRDELNKEKKTLIYMHEYYYGPCFLD